MKLKIIWEIGSFVREVKKTKIKKNGDVIWSIEDHLRMVCSETIRIYCQ